MVRPKPARTGLAKVIAQLLDAEKFDPSVREGLVESLERQTSPLVQIAVIDLLVEIRQNEAADTLHEMAREPEINPEVRERAQWALGVLK